MKTYVATTRMGVNHKSCSQNQSCMNKLLNANNLMCAGPFDMCHI